MPTFRALLAGTLLPLAALASAATAGRAQAPPADVPARSLATSPAVSAGPPPAQAAPDPAAALHWRLIGPYRAGWATVAAGVPQRPNTFYFGAAGGGVWKTTDAGRTWQGRLQHEGAAAIGALAVAPSDPDRLYAGTGQVAARYDLIEGDGVYRSNDAGETWRNVGLRDSRQIGAVLVGPRDPDRVLVAALGHAFGPNPERGVYLTTDGGATWRPVLRVDSLTGAVDLARDDTRPEVVYAATWQMRMHPWLDYFQPRGGPGSAIWKSEDGGAHWRRLSGGGLPAGPLGRIGLAAARGRGGDVVYASIVDVGGDGSGLYRTGDGGASWTRVNDSDVMASDYFGRVTVNPLNADEVYVMGQSIRRSTDGGRAFDIIRGAPGGDDFHYLWIDPTDTTHLAAGADQGAIVTVNAGRSWSSWYNQPTGQFYHLGVDDRFPYRVYSGQQDNGTAVVTSRGPYGAIELRDWHPVGGDERDDMIPKPEAPDTVLGSGLGGHLSRFDEVTRQSTEVSPWPVSSYGQRPNSVKYRYTWITPLAYSPIAPHPLYVGAQLLFRSDDDGDHWRAVSPDLSAKKADAKGCDAPDPDYAVARDCGFGVIFSIGLSPLDAGVIWIGTDDGTIRRTADGGAHWANVTPPQLPAWGRVDVVEPSRFDTAAAYAAVNLRRIDRMAPLVMKTADGGRTWTTIVAGLPAGEYVNAVRADPERRGLLYAATNRSVYYSLDDGAAWRPLTLDLPTTPVRDLAVRHGDLIAATQGRGLWILDDLSPLRQWSGDVAAASAHLFAPRPAWRLRADENRDTPWPPETPLGENPPAGATVDYALAAAPAAPLTLTIRDAEGAVVRRFSSADTAEALPATRYFERGWLGSPSRLETTPGVHCFVWDLRYPRPRALSYDYSIAAVWQRDTPLTPEGPVVLPGEYTLTLGVGGREYTQQLEVRMDPRVHVSRDALAAQLRLAMRIDSTLAVAVATDSAIAAALRASGASAERRVRLQALRDGPDGTATIAGVLTSLATAAQSADAAPAQGVEEVWADYAKRLDATRRKWSGLR